MSARATRRLPVHDVVAMLPSVGAAWCTDCGEAFADRFAVRPGAVQAFKQRAPQGGQGLTVRVKCEAAA